MFRSANSHHNIVNIRSSWVWRLENNYIFNSRFFNSSSNTYFFFRYEYPIWIYRKRRGWQS